jgi:uncharacterized protein
MSAASDPFSEKETPSGEIKIQNGHPEPGVAPRVTGEDADSTLFVPASEQGGAEGPTPVERIVEPVEPLLTVDAIPAADELARPSAPAESLFERYEYVPPPPPPRRKPDFADVLLVAVLAFGASLCSGALVLAAMHYHLFGVSSFKQANNEIHYRIGSQAAWYVITLLFCVGIFPLLWRKSFFEGIQWRAGEAARRIVRLIGAASACFVAAIVDEVLVPGPSNTPIDETFRMPGAVWLLFAFGVTLAPLIEEIAYRGFLLPSLCTAWDWGREQFTQSLPPPPAADGFPRWSIAAMVFGSITVSVPFAWMHAPQTGYSMGPFLLLICISLVLCWVRLAVRSLAASVVVHASYNLLLFSIMALGTDGFKHLDKM